MRERSNCRTGGCDRAAWAKGYCAKHYYHAQRNGLLERPKCSVDNCEKPSYRRGMCNMHNLRWERHGDVHFRKKAANGEARSKKCSVEGCVDHCVSRDLCQTHASLKRRRGSETAPRLKLANGTATPERKKENRQRATKNYSQTVHGKLRRRYTNAKRRILLGICGSSHIKKEDFLRLWETDTCALCNLPISDAEKTIDHIVPMSKGGTNEISNMQIAHFRCNQRKGNRVELSATS